MPGVGRETSACQKARDPCRVESNCTLTTHGMWPSVVDTRFPTIVRQCGYYHHNLAVPRSCPSAGGPPRTSICNTPGDLTVYPFSSLVSLEYALRNLNLYPSRTSTGNNPREGQSGSEVRLPSRLTSRFVLNYTEVPNSTRYLIRKTNRGESEGKSTDV